MAHLDKVSYSSLSGTYLNYKSLTQNVTISGSVSAGGGVATFDANFSFDRTRTRADTYITLNGYKVVVNSTKLAYYSPGYITYQYAGAETLSVYVFYGDPTSIQVEFFITNNSGSPISLVTQTAVVEVVLYDAPFA